MLMQTFLIPQVQVLSKRLVKCQLCGALGLVDDLIEAVLTGQVIVRRCSVEALLVDQDVDFTITRKAKLVTELVFVFFSSFVDFIADVFELVFTIPGGTVLNRVQGCCPVRVPIVGLL